MAHELESGFFVKLPAWHGLGTLLEAPPTVQEALKLAGLDWSVKLERLGRMGAGGFTKANRWAVVRESDDAELGTVGKAWRPLQNDRAFQWFQPIVDAGLATLEAAGSLRGGARVWVLAKVVGPDDVIVKESDDRVQRYILLAHGHDGKLAIRTGLTGVRVVCQNTLQAAMGANNLIRILHHAKAGETLDAAREVITRANKQFDKAADTYRELAKVKNIGTKQLRAFVDAVFPPAAKTAAEVAVEAKADLEALLARPVAVRDSNFSADVGDTTKETRSLIFNEISRLFESGTGANLPGVKGTAWGAYNAMTEFLTHERGNDDDSRLNNTFFKSDGARAISGAIATFLPGAKDGVAVAA